MKMGGAGRIEWGMREGGRGKLGRGEEMKEGWRGNGDMRREGREEEERRGRDGKGEEGKGGEKNIRLFSLEFHYREGIHLEL
jgi:hypothetical protein